MANDLAAEAQLFQYFMLLKQNPVDILNYICKNRLSTLFPNILVFLRILLIIRASVADGERSFSKLILIKNCIRSTIGKNDSII